MIKGKTGRVMEYVIQGHYGQGWEDVDTHDNQATARENLKLYRENEPHYAHRLRYRREKRAS